MNPMCSSTAKPRKFTKVMPVRFNIYFLHLHLIEAWFVHGEACNRRARIRTWRQWHVCGHVVYMGHLTRGRSV